MKTYILIYEGFAHFEVMLASYLLKTTGEIVTVGLNKHQITSYEGFQLVPHQALSEVAIGDIDVFLVAGGDPAELTEQAELHMLLAKLDKQGKIIGGICSGTLQLAQAGILKNRKYTTTLDLTANPEFELENLSDRNIVVDGHIITAKAEGYVDFGLELGKMAGIYQDEADFQETVDFFKHFNS